MTLDKIGKYEFLIEPFHCDFSQRLFVGHLGNHLLNAADFHSNDRGFGMNYLSTQPRFGVTHRRRPVAVARTEVADAVD